jgi:class 3 adenylate cyclase
MFAGWSGPRSRDPAPIPSLAGGGYDSLWEPLVRDLPTGTVPFLFTDIEGSTRLLQELGPTYQRVHDDHGTILLSAISEGRGGEIRTEGDSFFAVFPTALGAPRAAVAAQRELDRDDWPTVGGCEC